MSGKVILLVEDNKDVQNFNKRLLEGKGFNVETALTLADARMYFGKRQADAIILDIGMPDGNGLDFLRELRQTSKIPVLILTGYGESKDVVLGFNAGCDDYLAKPYTFDVLLVRLKHLLKSAGQFTERISYGMLTMDILSGRAFMEGTDLLLKPKEFALLHLFAQNENKTLSNEYLYGEVWKQPLMDDKRSLQKHISELRNKLKDRNCGYTITAVYGKGYRYERDISFKS